MLKASRSTSRRRLARHQFGRRRTGAILTTELVLVMPVMLGLLLGIFEMSMLWVANNRVAESARAGARIGSFPGSSESDIAATVEQVLGDGEMVEHYELTVQRGDMTGEPVWVEVRVPMAVSAPNLLGIIGFGLGDREFIAHSVMQLE